ncbi:MAG: sterol desaturase family protein [Alphaproteobacteria bacterium]|nr:sterol desaturase family protein [Alphaproteobacteria bacterium]MBV9371007.1 sterol desaturase family protein [Alphaproteobacteria bacterium]
MIFAALLAAAAVLETLSPKARGGEKLRRWSANLILAIVWVALLRLLWPWIYPLVTEHTPKLIADSTWAFLPLALGVALSLLLLDLFQYWTHRLLHAVPWLWTLHRLHHSDSAVDASTGVRHHPLEPLANAPVQFALILVAGVPAEGAAAYALVATVQSVVSHSNVCLPAMIDSFARRFIVTPDMHRIHHSVRPVDANTNFGMVFPYWDHIFGTYRPRAEGGEDEFQAGVEAPLTAPA